MDDIKWMNRALELASKALGKTNPNPMVGAVIVKNNILISEDYHKKSGESHAEVLALNKAGSEAKGSTVYVSLEPCCHYGKTPPCTDALINAGVKKVVIACLDPNLLVAGKGVEKLKKAGIEVVVGILKTEAQKLNEVFFKFINKKLPFVALKFAMTLNGKVATTNGDSKWISCEESRRYVHQLRNQYQAIMAGIGTVLKDDPMLNTRLDLEESRDPIRIIIDPHLQIPLNSKIIQSSKEQKTIIVCSIEKSQEKAKILSSIDIDLIELNGDPLNLSLKQALKICADQGISSILLEGGGELNASMLKEELIDKIYCFIAPKIIGGKSAPGPIGGDGVKLMNQAITLKDLTYKQIENDVLITGYTGW